MTIPAKVVTAEIPLGVEGAVYYFYDTDRVLADAISREIDRSAIRIETTALSGFDIEFLRPGAIVITSENP